MIILKLNISRIIAISTWKARSKQTQLNESNESRREFYEHSYEELQGNIAKNKPKQKSKD